MESERGPAEAGVNAAPEQRAAPKGDSGFESILSTTADAGHIMVGPDIEIFPSRPRPDLASIETQAFDANDRRIGGEQFALLCRNSRVPAATSIGSYKNLRTHNILRLIQAGIIDWKPEGRQRLALVFEKPQGRRLLAEPNGKPLRIAEDRIMEVLIQPVLEVLQEFREVDMVHGAISLDNMFLHGAEGNERVMLGECLSSAPFFRQSALFCTIEKGMAQPSGRGAGTLKDDLYSLGICVAMLARGINFMEGKKPGQILLEKMEQGSFAFASGGERLHPTLSEFLRGVLNDDEKQRWEIDEALRWSEGRRVATKQQYVPLKATRPFVFRDEKYWDLRSLSYAFSQHVPEAAAALEKDHFVLWIKRNFEDKLLAKRLDVIWADNKNESKERVVAAVCAALDTRAPVRYRGLAIFPTGFAGALAEVMARQEDVQAHAEMIATQMFSSWLNHYFEVEGGEDSSGLVTLFEKCRSFLVQKMPVYGIERVLYMLNKEVSCMSPVLLKHVVLSPGGLLLALEDIARGANKPENILDRHMMAFISVREPKMIDPHLGHVISRDRGYQMVGIARTLAAIQRRFNTGAVPALGNWLISQIAPAVDRFNDRDLRTEINRRMGKLENSGNLAGILELIDNANLVQEDLQKYVLARREYAGLLRERGLIEGQLQRRKTFGRGAGRQVAMVISASLSLLCILGYLIMHFSGGLS